MPRLSSWPLPRDEIEAFARSARHGGAPGNWPLPRRGPSAWPGMRASRSVE